MPLCPINITSKQKRHAEIDLYSNIPPHLLVKIIEKVGSFS